MCDLYQRLVLGVRCLNSKLFLQPAFRRDYGGAGLHGREVLQEARKEPGLRQAPEPSHRGRRELVGWRESALRRVALVLLPVPLPVACLLGLELGGGRQAPRPAELSLGGVRAMDTPAPTAGARHLPRAFALGAAAGGWNTSRAKDTSKRLFQQAPLSSEK